MKHLKLFETTAEFEAVEATLVKPNVSYTKDDMQVHWKPLIICEESSVYEIIGTPSYPSQIEGTDESFNISFNYVRTSTDTACTETVTEGSDTVTVECGTNPSTSSSRIVSGTMIWNGIVIDYSLTQKNSIPTEYVEIGGIKWATMNIGATGVTDYGLYFQWGDTQGYTAEQVGSRSGQKAFAWADYKYCDGTSSVMTKYDNTTFGKIVLDASDDAAQAAWGGSWRMPTKDEFQALGTATKSGWTSSYEGSGVAGLVLTSKADSSKKLFFPAAGICYDGDVNGVGSLGHYWSSSISSGSVASAYNLYFTSSEVSWGGSNFRYYGYSVRAVLG